MKIIAATAFAFLLGAGVAWSEEPPAPAEPGVHGSGSVEGGPAGLQAEGATSMPFESIDTDKDGHISHAEAQADADLRAAFEDADTDGDGKLNETEARDALESGEEEEEVD